MKSLKDQVADIKTQGEADRKEIKSWKPGSPTPRAVKESVNTVSSMGTVSPAAKGTSSVLPSMQKAMSARLNRNTVRLKPFGGKMEAAMTARLNKNHPLILKRFLGQ